MGLGTAPVAGDGAMFIGTLSRLGLEPGSVITISPMSPKVSFTGKDSFAPERRALVQESSEGRVPKRVIKFRRISAHLRRSAAKTFLRVSAPPR